MLTCIYCGDAEIKNRYHFYNHIMKYHQNVLDPDDFSYVSKRLDSEYQVRTDDFKQAEETTVKYELPQQAEVDKLFSLVKVGNSYINPIDVQSIRSTKSGWFVIDLASTPPIFARQEDLHSLLKYYDIKQ